MKQFIFLPFFLLLEIGLFAQTKLIAHKSVSGTNRSFSKVYSKESSVLDGSNFGMAPRRNDKFHYAANQPQLDTVIFLSKTHAVMITNCEAYKKGGKTYTPPPFWKPGHDTVLNHPLFSKNHSLDSIKQVLKTQYSFANDVETTVFLGYDNDKQQMKGWKSDRRKNKKNTIPFVPIFNETQPPFGGSIALLFILGALSILGSVLVNMLSRQAVQ